MYIYMYLHGIVVMVLNYMYIQDLEFFSLFHFPARDKRRSSLTTRMLIRTDEVQLHPIACSNMGRIEYYTHCEISHINHLPRLTVS